MNDMSTKAYILHMIPNCLTFCLFLYCRKFWDIWEGRVDIYPHSSSFIFEES